MVRVPATRFTPFFSKNSEPRNLAAFEMDVFPVTNGDFLKFVTANPKWRKSNAKPLLCEATYLSHWLSDLEPGPRAPLDAPVTQVSWFAARAYLQSHGKRLPSTDEWEAAARADATMADASGNPDFARQILSWYAKPTPDLLPSVHTATANVFGIRGLHGLVWEWVNDFNNAITTGEGRSGSSIDGDFFCGAGSIASADPSNYAAFMRYAFRASLKGNFCVPNLGFRGIRSL